MAPPELVDIEDVVRKWAWQIYDITKSKDQSKIPRECLQMNFNWKRVKFIHSEPAYADVAKPKSPRSQVLFRTFFSNNTEQDQEYSFKTERTTRSSCEISVDKGFTIGYDMSMTLKTPCEVFEANAGFHRELSLTEGTGETFEEELTWGVDSQIKVRPKHKTIAELVISEDQYNGQFTVNSKFGGKIQVSLTNTKDNNSFVKSIDGNIAEIFKKEMENGLKGFVIEHNYVVFVTKGKCEFRYAIEQHVKLSEQELTSDDEE